MNIPVNQSTRVFDIIYFTCVDRRPDYVQSIRLSDRVSPASGRVSSEINETGYKVFVYDTFLHQLATVLDQRLTQIDFTVEKLASALAVCPRTLHRKTVALTTLSPTRLIRLYRLIRAIELLKQGYSVSDVASTVGFENLSYFTKCFTKQFKTCPSVYQKKAIDT